MTFTNVTECIVCVSGHDPLTFLSGPFPFWLDGSFMAQLSKVLKLVRWARSVPFPQVSLQRQVGCLLLRPVFMCSSQGRAYTVSWLAQIKSYVIATSDLWLCIHASNLLPSLPPHSPTKHGAAIRIGSRRDTPSRRQCKGAVWRPWDSVEELSGGTGTV